MRTIKQQHQAVNAPIDDLVTYRALPTQSVNHIDPFLFLNHHGPQVYPPHNHGLPFGPHPHRGFETVTFILSGDIMHQDTGGYQSIIQAGGIQWMTAGSGLIHSEVSSPEFKRNGQQFQIQILTTGEKEEENRKSGKRGADGAKKAKFSHPTGIYKSSDSGDERPSS